MLYEYQAIISDLKEYLIDGIHDGTVSSIFNGESFDSSIINDVKYKFILKYEDAETITDSTVIPVLLVLHQDQYFNGRVFYKGQLVDLKTLIVKQKSIPDTIIPKVKFFVIPHIYQIDKGNFGSILYDVKIDYMTSYDAQGLISKEIDYIIKQHYFKQCPGQVYSIISPHTKLHFIPTTQRILNQESILNRISQVFNIRFCNLV